MSSVFDLSSNPVQPYNRSNEDQSRNSNFISFNNLKENDDRCLHEAAQWSEKIEGYGSIKYVCVK